MSTGRKRIRKQVRKSDEDDDDMASGNEAVNYNGRTDSSANMESCNEYVPNPECLRNIRTSENSTNVNVANQSHGAVNAMDEVATYKEHVPDENHLLEMKTMAGNTFRNLLDTLKAVLNDANIIFTEKGLKLAAVDSKKHALVHLFMEAKNFELYHCKQRLVLGVDIDSLHRTMKTNKSNDLMCFIVRKDNPGYLEVFFENFHKGTKVYDKIKLLALKEYNIFDKIVYKVPVPEMDSQLLQSICREMSSFQSTLLEIQDIGGRELVFRNLNGTTQRTVVVKIGDSNAEEGTSWQSDDKGPTKDARGVFMLRFLKSFAKAANLSPRVKIYLQNDSPLICEYSIANLGTLKYVLSSEE